VPLWTSPPATRYPWPTTLPAFLDVNDNPIVKRGQLRPLLKGTFRGRSEPEYPR